VLLQGANINQSVGANQILFWQPGGRSRTTLMVNYERRGGRLRTWTTYAGEATVVAALLLLTPGGRDAAPPFPRPISTLVSVPL